MPQHIDQPTIVRAAGNIPKQIEEFVGRVNTQQRELSIARMVSPTGWQEPGQTPAFQEVSLVIRGTLHVEHEQGEFDVQAGEAVVAEPGEWIRYSTPGEQGAEYLAICLPAFSPETVHRDMAKGGLCGFEPVRAADQSQA